MATTEIQTPMSLETAVELFRNDVAVAGDLYADKLVQAMRHGENVDIQERDAFLDLTATINESRERVRAKIRGLAGEDAAEAAA